MADRDLTVHLKADDKLTPAAKKAADAVDRLDGETATVNIEAKGIDDITDKLGALPGQLGQVGGALGSLGAAGGIGALAAGLVTAANAQADMAISAKTTADLTGATVEEASKLQNVWGRTGADVNDLNDVLLQMNGALTQSPELAAQLGINLNDGKNITQRFVEMTDKLAAGQLSAQQASQLFGEEGVRQVGKLRTLFGGLSDDIEDMPAPIDDQDVADALEYKRAIDQMSEALKIAGGVYAKQLVSVFGDLATITDDIAAALPGETKGKDLAELFQKWGTGLGVVSTGLAAITGEDITASVAEDLKGAAVATDDAAEATRGYTAAGRDAAAAMQAEVDATLAGIDALTAMADARRASADSTIAARNAQRDFEEQLVTATEAFAAEGATMTDVAQAMDDTASSAADVADAQVRLAVDTAAASGETLTASQQQSTFNTSMVASARTAQGPLRDSIIAYIAQVNNIPPEKVSEIIADPDNASIDAASRAIDQAAKDRHAKIILGISYPKNYNPVTGTVGPTAATSVPATMTATTTTAAPMAVPAVSMAPIRINVPVQTPSITINTAVMGNRFDTQRTVTKALRDYERLNGRRP